MLWGHTGHVLPERTAPTGRNVLGEPGRGGADEQRRREGGHANQPSDHYNLPFLSPVAAGFSGG